MVQPTLNFNPNPFPKPGELFEPDTGLYKLYELLYHGGATTDEAAHYGRTHTRRISDIRSRLTQKGYSLTVVGKKIPGKKDFFYKLEQL